MEEWERPGMRGTVLSPGLRLASGDGHRNPCPPTKRCHKDWPGVLLLPWASQSHQGQRGRGESRG